MLTDTHTHPYYCDDSESFVQRAVAAGVDRMIMPNVDLDSLAPMKNLAAKFPENLRMAVGLHPTEVKEDADEVLKEILKELDSGTPYVAIGEIGIDLYWDKTFKDKQMQILDAQIAEAEKRDLPVIIHCREGLDETLEVLSGHNKVRGVFHSFGGTVNDAERILALNRFLIGINGIVTFKNSRLGEVVATLPSERILLETDSPYLAPVPHRGKANESSYLPYIAQTVAKAKGLTVDEVATITSNNSVTLFGF